MHVFVVRVAKSADTGPFDGFLQARDFYLSFVEKVRAAYQADKVKDGVFGAMMKVRILHFVARFQGWVVSQVLAYRGGTPALPCWCDP